MVDTTVNGVRAWTTATSESCAKPLVAASKAQTAGPRKPTRQLQCVRRIESGKNELERKVVREGLGEDCYLLLINPSHSLMFRQFSSKILHSDILSLEKVLL
jgi:hypothetical protein